jgi:hypothetical protein
MFAGKKIDFNFTKKEDKPFRVVIKKIHPTTPHKMIEQNIQPQIISIVSRNYTCEAELLPLYFVDFRKSSSNTSIFSLKKITYFKVKIEKPHHCDDIPPMPQLLGIRPF